jgi:hypothetical protein
MHDNSKLFRRRISRTILSAAFLFVFSSCGGNSSQTGDGPFGPPSKSTLLSPVAGEWVFDFDKTLTARKMAGASEKDIEKISKLYRDHPELGKMHPDLSIKGNEAIGSEIPASEYRFFSLHKHSEIICGKAWHHEDRHDPGDMSKCYVRLKINDKDLHFEVKMQEELPNETDPDLMSMPAVEIDSNAHCDAETPKGEGWSEWDLYVFTKK